MNNDGFMDKVFRNPHLVGVLSLLILVMGIYGSMAIKTDLFPPAQRPTVAVLVAEPGCIIWAVTCLCFGSYLSFVVKVSLPSIGLNIMK